MTDQRLLDLNDVSFAYDGDVALEHVTMHIEPGQAVAVIGPNGSGKSTMLKGVLGVIPLVAGEMMVFRPKNGRGQSGRIGYLPQDDDIDADFPITLRQVVMMGRYRRLGWFRFPGVDDRQAVADALEVTGLTSRAGARFGTLSGGQQQRGLLARALATKPSLLLLDEPFNALDQPNRDALITTLKDLKSRGVGILLTTHDLELAREVCDSILLVNRTQVAFGSLEEVLTLANLQQAFEGVQVEVDQHTVVLPGHEH
jgi:zinc/manganese transport system ATP-binding protein